MLNWIDTMSCAGVLDGTLASKSTGDDLPGREQALLDELFDGFFRIFFRETLVEQLALEFSHTVASPCKQEQSTFICGM